MAYYCLLIQSTAVFTLEVLQQQPTNIYLPIYLARDLLCSHHSNINMNEWLQLGENQVPCVNRVPKTTRRRSLVHPKRCKTFRFKLEFCFLIMTKKAFIFKSCISGNPEPFLFACSIAPTFLLIYPSVGPVACFVSHSLLAPPHSTPNPQKLPSLLFALP